LERRTGVSRAPADTFQITSLDVIVHDHQKLGSGGFGQVYVGDWHGVAVAVKVFERGVPQSVSSDVFHALVPFKRILQVMEREINVWKRLSHPHILQFHGACSLADVSWLTYAVAFSHYRSSASFCCVRAQDKW
jgi:serine/threonine protein kinase